MPNDLTRLASALFFGQTGSALFNSACQEHAKAINMRSLDHIWDEANQFSGRCLIRAFDLSGAIHPVFSAELARNAVNFKIPMGGHDLTGPFRLLAESQPDSLPLIAFVIHTLVARVGFIQ